MSPPARETTAVLLHQLAEAVDVDGLAALLGELLRQLDREPVGRGERERVLGVDRGRARRARRRPLPARERLGEPLLLARHDALDLVGVLREQRVRLAHLADDDARQPVRVVEADAARLVDRAAQEAPADVAAPLVRRLDPFRDQEARRAAVVGEHAVRTQRDRRSRGTARPTRPRSSP